MKNATLVFVIFLVGCSTLAPRPTQTPAPRPTLDLAKYYSRHGRKHTTTCYPSHNLENKLYLNTYLFFDANETARTIPRASLEGTVAEMQRIKQEVNELKLFEESHLFKIQKAMIVWMDYQIEIYLDLMADRLTEDQLQVRNMVADVYRDLVVFLFGEGSSWEADVGWCVNSSEMGKAKKIFP